MATIGQSGMSLSPVIRSFHPEKTVVAMGDRVGIYIDFVNGDEAIVKEIGSGKEHPVTGIQQSRFSGTLIIQPQARQSTSLQLRVKNRLMESTANSQLSISPLPEIQRFEPVAQIIKPGTAATLSVGFRNAERARLLDGSSGLAVWDNTAGHGEECERYGDLSLPVFPCRFSCDCQHGERPEGDSSG